MSLQFPVLWKQVTYHTYLRGFTRKESAAEVALVFCQWDNKRNQRGRRLTQHQPHALVISAPVAAMYGVSFTSENLVEILSLFLLCCVHYLIKCNCDKSGIYSINTLVYCGKYAQSPMKQVCSNNPGLCFEITSNTTKKFKPKWKRVSSLDTFPRITGAFWQLVFGKNLSDVMIVYNKSSESYFTSKCH